MERSEGRPIDTFKVGDHLLFARAKALGALKMPPFESKWLGPCKVMRASHPLYDLRLANGKKTRKPIHSRRLKKWVPCDIVATVSQPPDYACKEVNHPDAFCNSQSAPGRTRLVVDYRRIQQEHDDSDTSDEVFEWDN